MGKGVEIKSLNENYSTTKLCYKLLNEGYLDKNGIIKEELKFTIYNPTFGIQNSKFIGNPEDKFETMLFLPEGEGRIGEGGLRTKGYFKFSYEGLMMNDGCLILNDKYGNEYKIDNSTFKIQDFKELPLITVITVVYNGAKYLEETIQSVINQTYPNVEYIIIDGGSTDGTLDIIKKYEDYIDYWVSERDKGIYDAMNKGVMLTGGDLIGILGAGDKYSFDAILEIVKCFNQNPNIGGVYGNSLVYSDKGKLLYKRIAKEMDKIIKGMPVFHPEVFITRNVYKKLGFYDSRYKIAADYDFLLKAFINRFNFIKTDVIILYYRLGGVSSTQSIKSKKEVLEIKRNYNLPTLNTYIELVKYIMKKIFLISDNSVLIQVYRKIFYKDKVVFINHKPNV